MNFIDPTGLQHYFVVLASGINSNRGNDFWYWIKNEISWRLNCRGDSVTYCEVFPYGETSNTPLIAQAANVLADMNWRDKGGNDINYRITEANVQADHKIVLIGHSGGGIAVVDAYRKMDDYHKSLVTQVVSIGAPKLDIRVDSSKFTYIYDSNDLVTRIGDWSGGKEPGFQYKVWNAVYEPSYLRTNTLNPITNAQNIAINAIRYSNFVTDVHTSYFNSASKASTILNLFWNRAF